MDLNTLKQFSFVIEQILNDCAKEKAKTLHVNYYSTVLTKLKLKKIFQSYSKSSL